MLNHAENHSSNSPLLLLDIQSDQFIQNQTNTSNSTYRALKRKKRLQLKTPFINEVDPSWELTQSEILSCIGQAFFVNNSVWKYCVLSVIETNAYIQMCHTNNSPSAWRLELRLSHSSGIYTHYYALKHDNNDNGLIDDIDLIIQAFKEFYTNEHQSKCVKWIKYNI
ncbi:MAG: hypothetical protein KGO49_12815 [Gammaproteobacteria bacterium]|nr:hypothetical protein [Gammaproteobacteria bacterium]